MADIEKNEERKLNQTENKTTPFINVTKDDKSSNKNMSSFYYRIFHTILGLIAIYLSFRCNKSFNLVSFLFACCCPHLYIMFILATRGTCGIIPNELNKN